MARGKLATPKMLNRFKLYETPTIADKLVKVSNACLRFTYATRISIRGAVGWLSGPCHVKVNCISDLVY